MVRVIDDGGMPFIIASVRLIRRSVWIFLKWKILIFSSIEEDFCEFNIMHRYERMSKQM